MLRAKFTLKTSHVAENGSTANPTKRSATAKLTKIELRVVSERDHSPARRPFTYEKIRYTPKLMRTEYGGDN